MQKYKDYAVKGVPSRFSKKVWADVFRHEHITHINQWQHGEIKDFWIDKDGFMCIKYESGVWFHYGIENNEIVWW